MNMINLLNEIILDVNQAFLQRQQNPSTPQNVLPILSGTGFSQKN